MAVNAVKEAWVAKVMTAKMPMKAGRVVMRTGLAESTARAARARAAQARAAQACSSTTSQRRFTAFRVRLADGEDGNGGEVAG